MVLYVGDVLWAVMVYLVAAAIFNRVSAWKLLVITMVGCWLVEFSQLYQAEWINRVRHWPLVRECYAVSGDADFILKCIGRDIHAMQDFVIKELTAAPNVDSVKTTLILDITKYEPGVPIA